MTGPSRAASRFTAGLCVFASICAIDTISELARFATDANDHLGWLRLVIGGLNTVGLSTWALLRMRARNMATPPPIRVPIEAPTRPPGRWRRARWLLLPAVIALGAFTIVDQWSTLNQAIDQLHRLDWHWVRWAIYAEVGSILAFAFLWARLLRARETKVSLGSIIAMALAGNALLVSLPGGLAWSTTFSFKALRQRGVTRGLATRVLVVSTGLSVVALAALALVGVDLADTSGPVAGLAPLITGIAVGAGLLIAALVLVSRRRGLLGRWQVRLAELAGAFPRRTLVGALAAALSNWVLDCICLVAAILAVGGHVPWQGVLVAYTVGQLAQNFPVIPGGIGVVEGALTLMLVAYGMHNSTALAAVLLYRIISFWLLVPVGWATLAAMVMPGRRRPAVSPAEPRTGIVAPLA